MRRLPLLAVLVAAGIAATAAAPERAWACSCAGEPPEALLDRGDAAFVGLFTGSDRRGAQEAVYRFTVEQVLKGTLPPAIEVWSAADGAACGIELAEGQRSGLVLTRRGGRWQSGLCDQADATALAAAAPRGGGRIATSEEEEGGFGRLTAVAALVVVGAGAGLFLIRRRYRPD